MLYDLFYTLKWRWWMIKTQCFYRLVFGSIGPRSTICRPMYLAHPENMYFGRHVRVREMARLETIPDYDDQHFTPRLEVGDDVGFEQGLHLSCADRIQIGNRVTISAYVMILDSAHGCADLSKSVLDQTLTTDPVSIGDGCFIGLGARILPGVHLGANCTVGTNAVVLKGDYLPGSVLVGVPARCVKRYDFEQGIWRATDRNGQFL